MSDSPKPSININHLTPLHHSKGLLEALTQCAAPSLTACVARLGHSGATLATGFLGSALGTAQLTVSGASSEASSSLQSLGALIDAGWTPIDDPFTPDEGLPIGAITTEDGALAPDEVAHLGMMIHAARIDHLGALVADTFESPRSSKAWIYEVLANLPALIGVDHSAALLLPARLRPDKGPPQYVVAAEQIFLKGEEHGTSDHLVGLLIPCHEGQGGLLEGALSMHRQGSAEWFHLFIPDENRAEEKIWRVLGDGASETHFVRFDTAIEREPEGMMMLMPLPIPGPLPAFLALDFRSPLPLSEATVKMLAAIRQRFGDALVHSDLFRVSIDRIGIFDAFTAALEEGPCHTRRTLTGRLSENLYEALGAASVGIGLLSTRLDGQKRLNFENPQGWDLDEPLSIELSTSDSLSALAIRLGRPVVLTGGFQPEGGPSIRWHNAIMVHEGKGLLEDARMQLRDYKNEAGWRPLADYYKPTASSAIYAGLALPIWLNGEIIGVLGMDFDRSAPWDAYSGFGTQSIYQTLAGLIASHLALLPED